MIITPSKAQILPLRDLFAGEWQDHSENTPSSMHESCFIESRKVKAERPLKNPLIGAEITHDFYEFSKGKCELAP